MRTIVFSEGKNDVELLKQVHQRNFDMPDYCEFLAEEANDSQTTWLRRNKVDGRFNYLYKSEEGVGNLIKQFRSHFIDLMDFSLAILADLDGGTFDEFISEINGKFHESYGNKAKIRVEHRRSRGDLVIGKTILRGSHFEDKALPIVAFEHNLERSAGICNGDSRSNKIQKIHTLLENDDYISEEIHNTLLCD